MLTIQSISLEPRQSVTREDLLALAKFFNEREHAVSFYFSLSPSTDNSHREEVLKIKSLVKNMVKNAGAEEGLAKDLDAIVAAAEQIRHEPSRLRAVFACHDQSIRQVFDLPACAPISFLDVGRHFHLMPLLQALQASAPYCVTMVEHGKARAFVVEGTDIREIPGLFRAEDINEERGDSRVGWSRHIEGNAQEHAKAYLKRIGTEIHRFMEKHQYSRLVIGCREDLWSELEPQLPDTERAAVIGRFHTTNFDVSPVDVLQAAKPIFQESLRLAYEDLLRKINEDSSRSAVGLNQVLESLEEGRVQKLLLGAPSDEKISECLQCGHLHAGVQGNCVFCGNSNTHAVPGQEALIRKALSTEAEILLRGPGGAYGSDQVAAWLRY